MRFRARFIAVGIAAGVAAVAAVSTFGVSSAWEAVPAEETQPSIVEDYSYPGAAQVLHDRALTLISGDGHIMLADCASQTGLLQVHAFNSADHSSDPGHYCFKVSGPNGYLRMTVPYAYQIRGDDHTVQATVTINGQDSTVAVAKNNWTGIGEGAGTDPATLVELRASS
jgi:hypothetical protein